MAVFPMATNDSVSNACVSSTYFSLIVNPCPFCTVSPSPNTKFRKRLHLTAIEEDDGQTFVKLDSSGQSSPVYQQGSHATSTHTTDVPSPPLLPNWFPSTAAAIEENLPRSRSIRFQSEADEVSVLSSLAGDYPPGNGAPVQGDTQQLYQQEEAITTLLDSERMIRFQQDQEKRFQETRQHIEQKLAAVLEQNAITKVGSRLLLPIAQRQLCFYSKFLPYCSFYLRSPTRQPL
jgi:hypothetical protein